ncbi:MULTISPECIES: hypothetical protein [Shewanella]|jgi:hypothetical protein|uniref:hypothetical protein n=1 Tax=Shewanella TaxID=22 RepID=UPI002168363F|nr:MULTISPECIES: hypothetical protein [Shewanella]MCS6116166.1 hypothetical protein [Shewanella baltica]MCS6128726.1 hypothetical protein [Shewanella baltica]MCS6140719.1 hypothetical protein [Shewanella baltica]MCS6146940.1 hypothetical protein [Shewanella baltica]MCS6160843.1 hypothetical protein [Shewanella baltica]
MKISKLVEHQYRAKPKQLALKPILHLVCVLEEILGNASAEQLLAIIKDHQQLVALRKQCATPHHNTLDVYRIVRKTSPFRARMNSATAKPF